MSTHVQNPMTWNIFQEYFNITPYSIVYNN